MNPLNYSLPTSLRPINFVGFPGEENFLYNGKPTSSVSLDLDFQNFHFLLAFWDLGSITWYFTNGYSPKKMT
jgi:hypothetical protein